MSAGITPNNQGVYSPLPFSDTESSEEEVFNQNSIESKEEHVSNRNITSLQHKSSRNGEVMATAESSLIAEYRPLSNSETSLNGLADRGRLVMLPNSPTMPEQEDRPNTPAVPVKQHGWSTMSPLRKACFVGSLFLCVFTVVGFLWLLPCDLEGTCPRRDYISVDHTSMASAGSWEAELKGVEVTGAPTLAQGHLVLTVRGPQPLLRSMTLGEPKWKNLGYGPFQPDHASAGQAGGGVLALRPDTGALSWSQVTPGAAPKAVTCDLLDATGDGRHDCLLSNPDWLLAALDPAIGTILWYLHVHRDNSTSQSRNSSRRTAPPTQRKPARLKFPPLKVRDIDGDGVPDLCALCSPQLSSSLDNFVLVSGKSGNVIGRLVNISGCVSLTGLELEEADNTLAFTCINQAGGESVRIMTVGELYLRAVNRSQQDPALLPPLQKRQQPPRMIFEPSWGDGRSYTLQVRGHHLNVENTGTCPRCRCLVVLTDTHNNTVWSYRGRNERAMAPVVLQFSGANIHKGTVPKNRSFLSGFVLKFWQWAPPNASRMQRSMYSPEISRWNPDHMGVEEGSLVPDVRVSLLKERVLLITFNDTDLHVINASQSDVTQLCAMPPLSQRLPGKEPVCQPELSAQQYSLLVADLDEDGTQELVSFTSAYSPISQPITGVNTTWELVSKVKVIHLETELAKLA